MKQFLSRWDPATLEALKIFDNARLAVWADINYRPEQCVSTCALLNRAALYLINPERHFPPQARKVGQERD